MAAGLVAISSGVRKQSSKAVGCSEAANSGETLIEVPAPAAATDAHPGTSSPSVEMPSRTTSSGETPSDAAVDSRNACAKAMAAGLVVISSGVR